MKRYVSGRRVPCASLLFAGLMACLPLPLSAVQSVKLAWNPSSTIGITNYNVYYWQQNGVGTNKLAFGSVTNAAVPGLTEGKTYYFSVTADSSAGLESPPSSLIAYTVPTVAVLQMQTVCTGGKVTALTITAGGAVPAQWTLQCSTNLLTWSAYARGTNIAVNLQVPVTSAPRKFFRLVNQ